MNTCAILTFLILTNCGVMYVKCAAVPPECIQGRTCFLPNCLCRGSGIPGGLLPNLIPQMVVLSIDGSLTETAYRNIKSLIGNRLNPSRCPLSLTYFVSPDNSVMSRVKDLHRAGAEIALLGSFGKALTFNSAREAIEKSRNRLHSEAGVPKHTLRGWRDSTLVAPGEIESNILKETGFLYDSSFTVNSGSTQAVLSGMFPFTLDYGWGSSCTAAPCPSGRGGGLWEVPVLNAHAGALCPLSRTCSTNFIGTKDYFQPLLQAFRRHYFLDRTPMVLTVHSDWLSNPSVLNSLKAFADMVLQLGDVYFVSMHQVIDWAKQPTATSDIQSFEPWQHTCRLNAIHQDSVKAADSDTPHTSLLNTAKQETNFSVSMEDIVTSSPPLTMSSLNGAIDKIIINRREQILQLYGTGKATVSQKNLIFIVIGGVVALFVFTAGIVYFCKVEDSKLRAHKIRITHNAIYEFAS